MDIHNKEFLSRINKVLAGRRKHPWGKAIGLKNAIITTIFDGKVPTAPTLEKIHRAENVRLDWLVLGEGSPYFVNDSLSDAELAHTLARVDTRLATVYAITDGARVVVAVSAAAVEHYDDNTSGRFTSLDVFAPVGAEAFAVLRESRLATRWRQASAEILAGIATGELGPPELLTHDGAPGLLETLPDGRGLLATLERLLVLEQYNDQERALLSRYRLAEPRVRDALDELVAALGRTQDESQLVHFEPEKFGRLYEAVEAALKGSGHKAGPAAIAEIVIVLYDRYEELVADGVGLDAVIQAVS